MIRSFVLSMICLAGTQAFAGGISGGGGETLPDRPVSVSTVAQVAKNAKKDLRLYYRYQQYRSRFDTEQANPRFYQGTKNLLTVLEKAQVEILMDRPCFDNFGKEIDGSISASIPDTICLSAFRIAPKLGDDRARVEVLALMTHELSHLLGATEEEADQLQEQAVFDLKQTGYQTGSDLVQNSIRKIDSYLRGQDLIWQVSSQENLWSYLEQIEPGINFGSKAPPFSVFQVQDFDFHEFQLTKFMLAKWYAISVSNRPDAHIYKKKYENLFRAQKEISLQETGLPTFGKYNVYKSLTIQRIEIPWELKNQVREIGNYLYAVNSYLLAMHVSEPLAFDPSSFFKSSIFLMPTKW